MNRYTSLKPVHFKIACVYICREDMSLLVDFYHGIIISFAEKEKASENRPSILFTAYKTQRTSYNLNT